VVIFGNGYESPNRSAVLFILDALTGSVVRKIDTGVTGCNGLSKPAVIDMDNDYITDYVYAGDLKGNLWKFNLRDEDPDNWDIAYNDGATPTPAPKPLFTATGQPITSAPDVMYHPEGEHGLLVIFATGKYLGETDRTNMDTQSVYGIWDYGDDEDPSEYLGAISDRTTGALSYPSGISLVRQGVALEGTAAGTYYRVLSDNPVVWSDEDNPLEDDPDGAPQNPDPVVNAGWFFDFPNVGDYEGERVFKDIIIRSHVAIVLSFIPDDSPCSGGGSSFLYYMDAANGGLREEMMSDLDGDGDLDDDDLVVISTDADGNETKVPVSSTHFDGEIHSPKFVRNADGNEIMYMSTSAGTVATQVIQGARIGLYYWLVR
jgi:type IV pilus assembly protein PilY1